MKFLVYIAIIALVFSCKKAEDRTCSKSYGEITTEERSLTNFTSIYLGPHIEYTLIQDTINMVVIRTGKNLVNHIKTEVTDGELSITNENKCNFLRSYKKGVEVELHLVNVDNILFEGTKELTCANKLNSSNLNFVIRDGAGHVDLDVLTSQLKVTVTHGWGNFTLHGDVNYLRLDVRSNGFGDTYDLNVVDSLHVISATQENVLVNANNSLMRVQIKQDGNVWYKGQPTSIELTKTGSGELIDKN